MFEKPCPYCDGTIQHEKKWEVDRRKTCSPRCASRSRDGTLEEKFWRGVDRGAEGACWEWKRSTTSGYGGIKHNGQNLKAHRVSWLLHNGPIPDGDGFHGVCVCHTCDNRKCVNPAHLFLSSHRGNVHDMMSKKRGWWQNGAKAEEVE